MTMTQHPLTTNQAEKKRLGQYFTGMPLAQLLASLAAPEKAASIIDPMVGSGDMLLACLETGATNAHLEGWDIDARAVSAANRRLKDAHAAFSLRTGSAFEIADGLATYDLVITNPPYVRYQSTSISGGFGFSIPSAEETRAALRRSISRAVALEPSVRALLLKLTDSYSGLSDLAVPAWLLCAALTRPGGTLAILVPQSWMNRDYAAPIRQLLGALFDVDYLVEDQSGTWFNEALIRTTLVVATRKTSPTLNEPEWTARSGGYVHVRVGSAGRTQLGLVGSVGTELEFASKMRVLRLEGGAAVVAAGVEASYVPKRVEATLDSPLHRSLPTPMRALLATVPGEFTDLAGLGWNVGQGLRTGANEFFYAEDRGDETATVLPRLSPTRVRPPHGTSLPAVRRQADLPTGYCLSQVDSRSRLIYLDGWARKSDALSTTHSSDRFLEKDFAAAITKAEKLQSPIGSGKTIPELSAVRTNARDASPVDPDRGARYWYQLPALQNRHRPDLIVPRVCGGRPRTYRNPDRALVVDANFSSLWSDKLDAINSFALLALLNSDYVAAMLEMQAHVLGGGALKVEATHLRQLIFPRVPEDLVAELEALGRALCAGDVPEAAVLKTINHLVARALDPDAPDQLADAVSLLAEAERARRA